jgi:hypothetical protein
MIIEARGHQMTASPSLVYGSALGSP